MEAFVNDLKGFLSFERLSSGPWQAFERGIARLLCHSGWEINEIVGGSGDNGADIIAGYRDNNSGELIEFIYQAKFSENNKPLTVDIIGDLKRAMEFYEINRGVAVSNRTLSKSQEFKLDTLKNIGYNIDTFLSQNIYDIFNRLPDWVDETRSLKSYQVDALARLQKAFILKERRALICLATGLGKTFVAASFLRWVFERQKVNVLILANTKSLIEQFDKSIWTSLPKNIATHLVYDSEKPAFLEGVTLSTFQSFKEFYKTTSNFFYDIIIVDEAHHAPADTYSNIIKNLDPTFLIGLTATPFRKDGKDVAEIFGEPLIYYSVYTALQKGFLSKVEYHLNNDNIDHDWITQNSTKGHTIKQLNKKLFLPERDETICQQIYDTWKARGLERGIIFCNSSEHAERIEKLLKVNFQLPVWSLTTRVKNSRERAKRLRDFRTGKCKILTCFDMLNEGIDVPDVDFIVFMRVTHSRVYFLQQLGRGLRYKEGKSLLVLDFVADIRRVKRIKNFQLEYEEAKKNEIEELYINNSFQLTFSSEQTMNFLDIVTKDVSEEMEENDEIFI